MYMAALLPPQAQFYYMEVIKMPNKELTQREIALQKQAETMARIQNEITTKIALLEKLGLTEDEAKLLLS